MRYLAFACAACLLTAPSPQDQLARDIYKQLVEINTTQAYGTTRAAEAVAARLKAAGFADADVHVLGAEVRKKNLVARLHGTGARKPLLLIGHLDVVEARREDWSTDPFQFLERDGFFYGRGVSDNKAGVSLLIASLIRLRQEGFRPKRDLILALTADEESGGANGIAWLVRHRRDLIDAEYCLNPDGGGGEIRKGRHVLNEVQVSEKGYLSFRLEVKNKGGHSSLPVPDNAIYHLADGLARLEKFEFPVRLIDTTRAFFERMAQLETPQNAADMKLLLSTTPPDPGAVARLAASPYYNAMLRTTCVATRLEAGHAENALPQTAQAVVNCRLIPGHSPEEVRRTLVRVVADDQIVVTPLQDLAGVGSPPSPLNPEVMGAVAKATSELWPGVPVVPVMATGGTDGKHLRVAGIPTYGVSGLFEDVDDVRAHGRDERVAVQAFYEAREFLYRVIRNVAADGPR